MAGDYFLKQKLMFSFMCSGGTQGMITLQNLCQELWAVALLLLPMASPGVTQPVVLHCRFVPSVSVCTHLRCGCMGGRGALATALCAPTQPAPSARESRARASTSLTAQQAEAEGHPHVCLQVHQGSNFFSPVMLLFTFYPGIIFLCFDSTGLEISRN